MREIVFRGKRVDNGKWAYGSLWINMGKPYILTDGNSVGYKIDSETVGQFTELHDKNGERIFEGDVVDILTENEEIGVVTYEDGGFWVNADGFNVDFHSNINGTDLEIIGTIYDDPELLEGETK